MDKTIELIDTTKKVLCKSWKDTLAAPDLHKDEPDEGIDDGVGGIFAGLLDPLEGAVVAGEAEVMLRAVYSVPCPTTTSAIRTLGKQYIEIKDLSRSEMIKCQWKE